MAKEYTFNPILIENAAANDVVLKIQGVIGFPEWWQFEDESDKISTKEKMRDEIEKISNIKAKRITVKIDSFGGDVNHAIGIYNALRSTGASITTEYTGWSASAATIVGMAGEKRIIPDNGYLLIHQAQGGQWGTADNFQSYAEFLKSINNTIADIYANVGGVEKSKIEEQMNVDGGQGEWITSDKALELGLVTEITKVYQAAAYTKDAVMAFNLPTNNLKFDTKMENTIKDKIAGLLGIQNDAELLTANAQLTSQVADLQAVIDAHPAEIEAIKNQLNEANVANEQAATEITNLNGQITERDNQITALQQEIEGLKAELALKPVNVASNDPDPAKTQEEHPLVKNIKELLKEN